MSLHASADRVLTLYGRVLSLYPRRFRVEYGGPMIQSLADALSDPDRGRRPTFAPLIWDLSISLIKEHIAMLRDTFARPALIFNAVLLAGISTILALGLYAIPQQVLRQGANDPQLQLAGDLVARLEDGTAPADIGPVGKLDMARTLSPFVIVYDDQGRPVTSQAVLNGSVPAPPAGVFEHVRTIGQERVSWQPVRGNNGVRIAAVVERVGGAHPGFVLAGRSLREVEMREAQVQQMAGLAWIGMLGLILAGSVGFAWYSGKGVVPPSLAPEKLAD